MAGWLLSIAAGSIPLQARLESLGPSAFEESDLQQFMHSWAWDLRSCDTASLAKQFVPGSSILVMHANSRQERINPSDEETLQLYCRPYRLIKWEALPNDMSYKTGSGAPGAVWAVVRWDLEWGGEEPGRDGKPLVIIHNSLELTKKGKRIRIMKAGERIQELVPGAEETFYLRTQTNVMAYPLVRFGAVISRMIERISESIRQMLPKNPAPQQP